MAGGLSGVDRPPVRVGRLKEVETPLEKAGHAPGNRLYGRAVYLVPEWEPVFERPTDPRGCVDGDAG